MRRMQPGILGAVAVLALTATSAWAGHWCVGINLGFPLFGRPYCGCGYYYYRPYPVVVGAAPVVVQPVPVAQPVTVVAPTAATQAVTAAPLPAEPIPVVQPAYHAPASPTPQVVARASAEEQPSDLEQRLRQLTDLDEHVRADAAVQLGRMKVQRAVEPLTNILAADRSPHVREAAARALALVGDPRVLPSLRQAALTDTDPEVRHSAQFAVEVVQATSSH